MQLSICGFGTTSRVQPASKASMENDLGGVFAGGPVSLQRHVRQRGAKGLEHQTHA